LINVGISNKFLGLEAIGISNNLFIEEVSLLENGIKPLGIGLKIL